MALNDLTINTAYIRESARVSLKCSKPQLTIDTNSRICCSAKLLNSNNKQTNKGSRTLGGGVGCCNSENTDTIEMYSFPTDIFSKS